MSILMKKSAKGRAYAKDLPLVAEMEFEDSSPFGLQGLERETLTVVKSNCIRQFAASLALSNKGQQAKNPEAAEKALAENPQWHDEYRIVHLIEQSLWFEGRCDFVMQMSRNPSQIPDNPPTEIRRALAKAYALHPEATIWYGVPVFGEEENSDGLPIPLTASQVQKEAVRRLSAAQRHALRMGWFYRYSALSDCL